MNAPELTKHVPTAQELLEEEQRARAAGQARHISGRIPLYAKALGDLRAAVVAGEDPETFWPKSFSPLTAEERQVVRARFLEVVAKNMKAIRP